MLSVSAKIFLFTFSRVLIEISESVRVNTATELVLNSLLFLHKFFKLDTFLGKIQLFDF